MHIVTVTSREFNHDIARAKREAKKGPVIITDRGEPAHVLLSVEQYQSLTGSEKTILELLEMEGVADVEIDLPRIDDLLCKPVELT